MRQQIKAAFAAALLCVCASTEATRAETPTFSLGLSEARVAARQAALAGNFTLARDLATALLEAEPDDRSALIVLAATQPQLGAPAEGRAAGARAFRLSETPQQRYEAARLTALAAANQNRFTLAQIWLRRAAINAPDDASYAQTAQDYRRLRAQNPWALNIEFSVAPSNNVNGGTENGSNEFEIGLIGVGLLSADTFALSGVVSELNVKLSYRLSENEAQRSSVTARSFTRAVWLSDDAKESLEPTPGQPPATRTRNSDFKYEFLELGATHQRRAGDGVLSFGATVGQSWFGQEPYSRYVRSSLGYSHPSNDQTRLSYGGSLDRQFLYANDAWDLRSERIALNTGVTRRLNSGDVLSAQLVLSRQFSDNANDRYRSLGGFVSYRWAEPIGPVELTLQGGVTYFDYPDYLFTTDPEREDTRIFASLQAAITNVEYAGFVPVLRLTAENTDSNVTRFERNTLSLGFALRSSF